MYHISLLKFVFANTESLDELSQLASTLFSPIANRGRDPLPLIPEHPFGLNEKGVITLIIILVVYLTSFPDPRLCQNHYGFSCTRDIIPIGLSAPFLET